MIDSTKLEHFRNLVSLITVDGKIEEVERVALFKIAYTLDIPLDRFNLMLERGHEYRFLIPQNTHDREKQLQDMIEIAHIDGDFAPAELELINMVGEKLGFSPEEIQQIIQTYSPKLEIR
ncbi:TerB family tellurite resistance protein [Ohtaekwangia sp.]|uniref:TerB family tellurite resistance protein n=1 Tax=Ohtaekwangia sp. TaxID=2066019 RepID=UPI002F948AA4